MPDPSFTSRLVEAWRPSERSMDTDLDTRKTLVQAYATDAPRLAEALDAGLLAYDPLVYTEEHRRQLAGSAFLRALERGEK